MVLMTLWCSYLEAGRLFRLRVLQRVDILNLLEASAGMLGTVPGVSLRENEKEKPRRRTSIK